MAYLLSEKVRTEEFINGVSTFHTYSKLPMDKKNYRDIDLGLAGSIGYSKRLSKRINATIQTLYSIGIGNTNRSTAGDLINSSFEISIGISALSKQVTPK